MKRSFSIFALLVLLFGNAIAQPGVPPAGDAYTLLSGEHTPVIYSGSGEASSAEGYTTQWLQIGYSPYAEAKNNHNIGRFNPEQFTLGLKLTLGAEADSTLISSARFELAYDTTATAFWISDSTNMFISGTGIARFDYGVWIFSPLSDQTRGWLYPLRVLQGGYIRLVFETTTSDEVEIEWILTGEH
jgi:hypothetical protein